MAKRIDKKNVVRFDQVSGRWIIEAIIMCDTESDMPTIDEFENYRLAQGSLSVIIETSDRFRLSSDGTWSKEPSGGGSATLITKSITANGIYDATDDSADGYSSVSVSVPNTYTAEDEGKVVDNGSLVAQTAMSTEITANDTYDTTLYNSVTVNVPQGGASAPMKDVNFYDYDGTIVYSYTQAEFANLEAMPENPTHDGLTAQGWNWSLSDAKTYVASYKKLNIGQMYITSDGKTRLYITLTEGRTSPIMTLYLNANSEVDIDWGDGTAHGALTITSAGYVSSNRHNYASAGDYVIAITVVSGSISLISDIIDNGGGILNNGDTTSGSNCAYINSIKKVEIGSSVTSIGESAFSNCYSISSVTIPFGVTSIGYYAFQYCYSISSVTIPSSVTSIGYYAFQYCSALSSAIIPSSVTSIEEGAFNGCSTLSSITIPPSVTSIEGGAFSFCYSLSSATIPSSVTSIGTDAFSDCYSLSSVTIPSSVTSIENNAFSDCYSLSSVTIPSSVTSIGYYAFSFCYSLSSITIPSSVTSINSYAFSTCYSLATITIDQEEDSISGSPWGAITSAPTSTQIVWTG